MSLRKVTQDHRTRTNSDIYFQQLEKELRELFVLCLRTSAHQLLAAAGRYGGLLRPP